jgi:hypothetical protein
LSGDSTRSDTTARGPSGSDPGGGGRVLGAAITITGLLLAAAHVTWPDRVQIDAATLGLLLIAAAPWLGRIFQSIEFPGGWKLTYRELQRHVERELSQGKQQVDHLADRVERVEQFVFSGGTPTQQVTLNQALIDFDRYMKSLGYRDDRALPRVQVGPSETGRDPAYEEYNAFYSGDQDLIVVGSALADDPDVVLREYCHHILQGLMPQNPAGGGWEESDTDAMAHGSTAIHSALADYFPCSFHGDPCFGRAAAQVYRSVSAEFSTECLRNLSNDRGVASLGSATTPHQAGEVWAGAFWELRESRGAPLVDRALLDACREVVPWPQPAAASFVDRLVDALGSPGNSSGVRAVFTRRGLLPA